MARLGMLRRAKGQRVEAGDRSGAHGENIAQNASHARCSALIRLDVARMIVTLHLEHDRLAVANVDHAGILAGTLDHPGRPGRQPPQMKPRRLVRAVLVPHRREYPEFGEARHPGDELENALILVRLQAMTGDEFGSDLRLVHEALARLSSLIREIGQRRKGLLWSNFLLSIALHPTVRAFGLHIRRGSDLRTE